MCAGAKPNLSVNIRLGFAVLLSMATNALANSAVDATNEKFGIMLGGVDSEFSSVVEGSITWPIQEHFGLQIDGLYSEVAQGPFGIAPDSDIEYGGLGAHCFWRESDEGLLGLEAGYIFSDDIDSYEFGIEAEKYFDQFTVGAKAGLAHVSFDQAPAPIEDDKDSAFVRLYLSCYPTDSLLISMILDHRFDNSSIGFEIEYDLPVSDLSVFATAMKGEDGYDQAFLGARYYFGSGTTLKHHHRKSDPSNLLLGTLYGANSYHSEYQREATRISRSAATGGSTGGSGTIGGSTTVGGGTILGPGSGPGPGPGLTFGGSGYTFDYSGLSY